MQNNRFFQIVWQFNGLMLMGLGVLTIGLFLFSGYRAFRGLILSPSSPEAVESNPDRLTTWSLGNVQPIGNTSYASISLYSDQGYSQASYGKSSGSVRNILFMNLETNQKQWLFRNNDFLITNFSNLPQSIQGQQKPVTSILYTVVKKDTNNDRKLTYEDKVAVALSLPSGENYQEILTEVDTVIGTIVRDDNLFVVYQKDKKAYTATIGMKDYSLRDQAALPENQALHHILPAHTP